MSLRSTVRTRRNRFARAAVVGGLTLGVTGALVAPPAGATAKHSGVVNVLYAASLEGIMENSIGPAFTKATGYTFNGFPAASGALATGIKTGVYKGDVFISANEATNLTLEGPTNGNWLSAFVLLGQSPLVLGYNPSSQYAAAIKNEPWFASVLSPGIRLGRTDPVIDPKGKLTVQAVAAGVQIYNTTALAAVTASAANIYPEQTLVGLLQSGQLDAGFFYSSEAKAAGIPTVKLGKLNLAATYTIGDLANEPDPAAAQAFTAFLLGPTGKKLLVRNGVTVIKHRIVGDATTLARSVRKVINASV